MAEAPVSVKDVHGALSARICAVLAIDGPVSLDARFDQDLHADSLDLVEVIEGVERDLAEAGAVVTLDDDELLALRTVGEAVERIHAAIVPADGP